jgi:hypothetical protein
MNFYFFKKLQNIMFFLRGNRENREEVYQKKFKFFIDLDVIFAIK